MSKQDRVCKNCNHFCGNGVNCTCNERVVFDYSCMAGVAMPITPDAMACLWYSRAQR